MNVNKIINEEINNYIMENIISEEINNFINEDVFTEKSKKPTSKKKKRNTDIAKKGKKLRNGLRTDITIWSKQQMPGNELNS